MKFINIFYDIIVYREIKMYKIIARKTNDEMINVLVRKPKFLRKNCLSICTGPKAIWNARGRRFLAVAESACFNTNFEDVSKWISIGPRDPMRWFFLAGEGSPSLEDNFKRGTVNKYPNGLEESKRQTPLSNAYNKLRKRERDTILHQVRVLCRVLASEKWDLIIKGQFTKEIALKKEDMRLRNLSESIARICGILRLSCNEFYAITKTTKDLQRLFNNKIPQDVKMALGQFRLYTLSDFNEMYNLIIKPDAKNNKRTLLLKILKDNWVLSVTDKIKIIKGRVINHPYQWFGKDDSSDFLQIEHRKLLEAIIPHLQSAENFEQWLQLCKECKVTGFNGYTTSNITELLIRPLVKVDEKIKIIQKIWKNKKSLFVNYGGPKKQLCDWLELIPSYCRTENQLDLWFACCRDLGINVFSKSVRYSFLRHEVFYY